MCAKAVLDVRECESGMSQKVVLRPSVNTNVGAYSKHINMFPI